MRPLLVGLHNKLSRHPEDALAPWPSGCTGQRIVSFMQEVHPSYTTEQYMAEFDRANLWTPRQLPHGRGASAAYRQAGEEVYQYAIDHHQDVVLLGARVWSAVTNRVQPDFFDSEVIDNTRFWYLPHPSGRNLIYNTEFNRRRAGAILISLRRQA